MGNRRDLTDDLSDDEQVALSGLVMAFLNDAIIHGHMAIDHVHNFFIDHRGYIQLLEEFLVASGRPEFVPLPAWDPGKNLPVPFRDVKGMHGGVDFQLQSGPLYNEFLRLPTPPNLRAPCAFASVDEMARALGRTFELDPNSFHADSHRNLGPPLYDMHTTASAVIFWPLHAFFEQMYLAWEECRVAPAGPPLVVRAADGTLMAFVAGADGVVWRAVQRLANPGRWSHWLEVGGSRVGLPAGGVNANGRMELFAIRDAGIVRATQKQADVDALAGTAPVDPLSRSIQERIGWEAWIPVEAPFVPMRLGVARDADGRLHRFALDKEDILWSARQAAPNGEAWTAWERFESLRPARGFAVGENRDGRLEVVAVDRDGNAWHAGQERPLPWLLRWLPRIVVVVVRALLRLFGSAPPPSAPGWSGWEPLAGATGLRGLAAASAWDGRLMALAIGEDGILRSTRQTGPNARGWTPWISLDVPAREVSAARTADGSLAAFVVREDGTVWHNVSRLTGGWGTWVPLGGDVTHAAAACADDGSVEVIAVGADGLPRHRFERAAGRFGIWNVL